MADECAELRDKIKDDLEKRLKEQFTIGMTAGFDAGLLHAYKQTANLTSAKAIRAKLRDMVKQTAARNLIEDDAVEEK